jgi:signal recognition particle receptor subunit alpha
MTSLWQNLRLNKALTKEDLKQPIERMQQLLVEKNVATCIASKLCSTVERELLGKKLNTLHRVQTAVRQGLEKAIHGVLEPSLHVDLLREVLTKKETSPGWFGLGSAGAKKRRPFVICVLGTYCVHLASGVLLDVMADSIFFFPPLHAL